MADYLRIEVDDGVATITLDRPPVNAIDLQLGLELQAAIEEANGRDDVGAVVIWGGRKLFAVGADIRAMVNWGPDEVRPSVDALGRACDMLEALPKIAVAAVNGYALGGGLELALACDLRIAAADAMLGQPEVQIGVIPGAGGTQRLVPLVGVGRARELVFSGRQVPADEALSIGLVEAVVEADLVFEQALERARRLARGPRLALAAAKRAIAAAVESPGPRGAEIERQLFTGLFGSADQREGMRAFLEKRPPRFGAS